MIIFLIKMHFFHDPNIFLQVVPQEVVDRFYLTLMLYDLWHQRSIWDVSDKFQVARGQVFSLIQGASSFASCVLRFCEVPVFLSL